MNNSIFIIFLCLCFKLNSQITIDEKYNDWKNISSGVEDSIGDVQSGNLDFTFLKVTNDAQFMYLSFNTGTKVNLQDNNSLILYIDIDNNSTTGFNINGLGADFYYVFSNKAGYYYRNGNETKVFHDEMSFVSLPTVTSDTFELMFLRKFKAYNYLVNMGSKIRVMLVDKTTGGDIIPEQNGGFEYEMNNQSYSLHNFSIDKKAPDHLRIMTFNVETDNIFSNEPPYARMIKAISPDILCFEEIYDHSSTETKSKVKAYFGGTWYDTKVGTDLIVVSKYKIIQTIPINGNGAYVLDYNGKNIVVIINHLYCCDNDSGRQEEVDATIKFIREVQNLQYNNIPKNSPIIIVGDMNFVGDSQQRLTLLQGDIQDESGYGNDCLPDWDKSYLEDAVPVNTSFPAAFTWDSANSSYPAGRLDYVLYTGSVLKLENSYVMNTINLDTMTLNKYQMNNTDTQNASDHQPVVADFSLKNIVSTTDNTEFNNRLILSPNPAKDLINISLQNNSSQVYRIQIFNLLGQLVKLKFSDSEINLNDFNVDISDLQSGVYMLNINSLDGKSISEGSKFLKF